MKASRQPPGRRHPEPVEGEVESKAVEEPATIREVLLPALRERYPDRGLREGMSPAPVAVFPAAHPEVGDVEIWDHGWEATIGIGAITHGHFNPYDASLSPEESARQVTQDVIDFLDALFADRVLLWKASDGGAGGWRWLIGRESALPRVEGGCRYYVWSAPVRAPGASGGADQE